MVDTRRISRRHAVVLLMAAALLYQISLASTAKDVTTISPPATSSADASKSIGPVTTTITAIAQPHLPTTTVPETAQTTTTTTTRPTTPAIDIEEVKKIIRSHVAVSPSENRLAMNKPTQAPQMTDFAPESIEARVADATTQFGLNFINNIVSDNDSNKKNVVISPLSIQNLLNMVLLGSSDGSATQQELAKVLGYDVTDLLAPKNSVADRLKPHEAMRNVFQSILAATHLSVAPAPPTEPDLLNTNPGSLPQVTPDDKGKVSAHLQTSIKESEIPLSGQLNFTLANLVLTNKDIIELKPDYEKDLKTYYNVNVEQFSRAPAADAKPQVAPLHERINNWVKNMTQNQIEKLAQESDLSGDDLIMVLINAAHFKGRWLHTFNPKATHEKTFFNNGKEKDASRVKFMRQKGVFGYADFGTAAQQNDVGFMMSDSRVRSSEDAETLLTEDSVAAKSGGALGSTATQPASPPVIELSKEEARRVELTSRLNCSALMLPFSLNDGQELSMVILLPTKRDGVAELQAALNGPALNEIYRSLSEQQVQIELPKFSFEATHDAKSILLKMGLQTIFRESANLGRMYNVKSGSKLPAKVDKIIHKAKINVDEAGAEAAAASMASIVLRNFIRPPSPVFVADHPFLFIIRHNRSNMPLFMGRVSSL